MYVASSSRVTNPFLLEGAKREQEGLSLIPSNALKMIKNGNEMTVESRAVHSFSGLDESGLGKPTVSLQVSDSCCHPGLTYSGAAVPLFCL